VEKITRRLFYKLHWLRCRLDYCCLRGSDGLCFRSSFSLYPR